VLAELDPPAAFAITGFTTNAQDIKAIEINLLVVIIAIHHDVLITPNITHSDAMSSRLRPQESEPPRLAMPVKELFRSISCDAGSAPGIPQEYLLGHT
jgi:hypothetical protein